MKRREGSRGSVSDARKEEERNGADSHPQGVVRFSLGATALLDECPKGGVVQIVDVR